MMSVIKRRLCDLTRSLFLLPRQIPAARSDDRPTLHDKVMRALETAGGDKRVPVTAATPVGRKRYVTALLCLWVTTICYADRTSRVVTRLEA